MQNVACRHNLVHKYFRNGLQQHIRVAKKITKLCVFYITNTWDVTTCTLAESIKF